MWANDGSTNLVSGSVFLGVLSSYDLPSRYSSPVNTGISQTGQTGALISRLQALTSPRLVLGLGLYSSDDYSPISYTLSNINFTVA
jgi:hypothetical protein